jgi:hypothetical protein
MTRIVLLGTVCLAVAAAQGPSERLTALEQAAEKAEADWITLAVDLDARVSRFLPCDARAAAAIQEVSRASNARLAALNEYLQAVSSAATAETEAARRLLDGGQSAASGSPLERTDTEQERAGIESQILNLAVAATQRASLSAAVEQLKQIEALVKQRSEWAARPDLLQPPLDTLISAFQQREDAVRRQTAAFEAERTRWNTYYAARAERARLECTITGGGR